MHNAANTFSTTFLSGAAGVVMIDRQLPVARFELNIAYRTTIILQLKQVLVLHKRYVVVAL
jgi:hypothetical protein